MFVGEYGREIIHEERQRVELDRFCAMASREKRERERISAVDLIGGQHRFELIQWYIDMALMEWE